MFITAVYTSCNICCAGYDNTRLPHAPDAAHPCAHHWHCHCTFDTWQLQFSFQLPVVYIVGQCLHCIPRSIQAVHTHRGSQGTGASNRPARMPDADPRTADSRSCTAVQSTMCNCMQHALNNTSLIKRSKCSSNQREALRIDLPTTTSLLLLLEVRGADADRVF